MSINIKTNMSAVRAQRTLGATSDNLGRVFERLSSGQRINRPSDDAAGLAIASSLRNNARIATVAMRNAQDGISAVAVADGAMGSITSILGRLAELATQAANGTYSLTQRSAIQAEFDVLGSEIERIAVTTDFNGITLLSGSQQIAFQVGFDGASTAQIVLDQGGGATLQKLGLATTGTSALTYSLSGNTVELSQSAARNALVAVNAAVVSISSLRGTLGTVESRLSSAINNLQVSRENTLSAESRITDADVALEAAELTRLNILQQAGAAVLSQANLLPNLALQLLRG
jgi:flagellin